MCLVDSRSSWLLFILCVEIYLLDHANLHAVPLEFFRCKQDIEPHLLHGVATKDHVVPILNPLLKAVRGEGDGPVERKLGQFEPFKTVFPLGKETTCLHVPLDTFRRSHFVTV